MKNHLNVVVIGDFGCGKSTTIGDLIGSDVQGTKMEIGLWMFETKNYYLTLIDAPGDPDSISNLISAASQAHCALLVIDSSSDFDSDSVSRDHSLLAFSLGVSHFICCFNKMDSVNYSKPRYDHISTKVSSFLNKVGYNPHSIPLIPISALRADNITHRSSNLDWYDGPTLLEALDSLPTTPPATATLVNPGHPRYELLPQPQRPLSVPDLVWGKVKSHPWWPAQIFDSTHASEKAIKHHKKDCFLVAYFGDHTFAWNEQSTLKTFHPHFSQMVAQTNGDTFHNAVNCALDEVSRRVQLGLACSCVPEYFYDNIRVQVVENAGIRSEFNRREGVDESAGVNLLQPDKLAEYIRGLAQCPLAANDSLGLTVAKAQLLAFARFSGFCSLPEFQICGDLVENDTAGPLVQDMDTHPLPKGSQQASSTHDTAKVYKSSNKRKHNLRDNVYPKIKQKSLTELMGGSMDYPNEGYVSGKRRKGGDNHVDESTSQQGQENISAGKASTPPKQSFKIGECIRRVASQMTGSPSVKGSSERVVKVDATSNGDEFEGKSVDPTDYSSLDELLFQLQSIAVDPRKEYTFSNVIVNFFSDFRNSAIVGRDSIGTELMAAEKTSGKRKKGLPEAFEFDDMKDTYWTDMFIQNGVEEQLQPQSQPQPQPELQSPPRKSRKKDNQSDKTPQTRRPYKRKQLCNGNTTPTPETPASAEISKKPPGYIGENAPTELVMNFSEAGSVPSESNLNKMFRRFGALKETETEVERESGRARVVFKKCSDAEVAFNSVAKFNIFGASHVNYELNYNPVVQYKPSPLVVTFDHDIQLHEMDLHNDMQLDLSNLSPFEVNLV